MPFVRVVRQRQHGQGAVVAKALVRHAAVGLCVAHAADDDGAAKVGHLCAQAELAACGREAAVGGDQQRGRQALGRGVGAGGCVGRHAVQLGMARQRSHAGDLGAGEQAHARHVCRHGVGRAAQCVVGHDKAQGAGGCRRRATLGAAGRVQLQRTVAAQRAVVHLGLGNLAYLVVGQVGPAAQPLQRGAAGVGEGDFAAIGCGLGQGAVALLLDHGGGETGLGQGDGQRQARRACADEEHVAVVGGGHGRGKPNGAEQGPKRLPLWARPARRGLPWVKRLCRCLLCK